MVTKIDPEKLSTLSSYLDKEIESAPEELRTAVKTLNLSIPYSKDDDKLIAALVGLYLTKNLVSSGYVRIPSKDKTNLSNDELDVFKVLERAVMVALYHTRPIELLDVPKKKTGYQETPVTTDPCAFGIYPDLPQIEAAGKGRIISEIEHYFHT